VVFPAKEDGRGKRSIATVECEWGNDEEGHLHVNGDRRKEHVDYIP